VCACRAGQAARIGASDGSLFLDDLCLVDTYGGEIDSPAGAAELATRIGCANLTIWRITVSSRPVATWPRPSTGGIDRTGLQAAYDVLLTGQEPVKMDWSDMAGMQRSLIERAADVYWAGAARATSKPIPVCSSEDGPEVATAHSTVQPRKEANE